MNFDFDLDPIATPVVRPEPTGPSRILLKHLDKDEYILPMDWSSLTCFLECPQQAEWHLVFSRGTFESSALIYGRSIHKALATWYETLDMEMAKLEGERVLAATPPPDGEWRNLEFLRKTLDIYAAEYPAERFSVHEHEGAPMIELPFELPLAQFEVNRECPIPRSQIVAHINDIDPTSDPDPFYISRIHLQWTGVVDMICRQGSELWNLDHKTESRGGENFFTGFEFSQQFIGYTWAASKLLGERVRGTILNQLFGRKPTKSGIAREFNRRYYEYSDEKISRWETSIKAHCQSLIHSLMDNSFPMNTVSCNRKYGICPYHPVCGRDLRSEQLATLMSSNYTRNVWNPLTQ